MTTLDPNLAAILKDSGLGNDAVWAHKQSGKYIMYHWACERAAAKKGIVWDSPTVVTADPINKIAVLLVSGKLGDKSEWSFGEAAPYNTTQTYPFAMAEKRGKDRVLLKLIDMHGLLYSEEEAEDFKPTKHASPSEKWHGPLKITELKDKMRKFKGDLEDCEESEQLMALLQTATPALTQCQHDLPEWYFGDGGDVRGAAQAIKEKREQLAGMSRV